MNLALEASYFKGKRPLNKGLNDKRRKLMQGIFDLQGTRDLFLKKGKRIKYSPNTKSVPLFDISP